MVSRVLVTVHNSCVRQLWRMEAAHTRHRSDRWNDKPTHGDTMCWYRDAVRVSDDLHAVVDVRSKTKALLRPLTPIPPRAPVGTAWTGLKQFEVSHVYIWAACRVTGGNMGELKSGRHHMSILTPLSTFTCVTLYLYNNALIHLPPYL